jgi:hypothetical protein
MPCQPSEQSEGRQALAVIGGYRIDAWNVGPSTDRADPPPPKQGCWESRKAMVNVIPIR